MGPWKLGIDNAEATRTMTTTTPQEDTDDGGDIVRGGGGRLHKRERLVATQSTLSTLEQAATEDECAPFFVNLSRLPPSQIDHLRATGFLPPSLVTPVLATDVDVASAALVEEGVELPVEESILERSSRIQQPQKEQEKQNTPQQQDPEFYSYCWEVGLLRDPHETYLQTIFAPSPPLRSSYVSLDSSRTWMVYWCLHGLDLLTTSTPSNNNITTTTTNSKKNQRMRDIVAFLRRCFTRCSVTLDRRVVEQDPVLSSFGWNPNTSNNNPNTTNNPNTNLNSEEDKETISSALTFANAGGFGGGPDQMPHAATTYAAVLALCILASTTATATNAKNEAKNANTNPTRETDSNPDSSPESNSDGRTKNNPALELLTEIRPSLYPWFVSLHTSSTGSFRMHADGEIDVRASYCVVAVAQLLNLLSGCCSTPNSPPTASTAKATTSVLTHKTADYVVQCQTWEGGFGGEPGAEAHGGYSFCAVATLALLLENNDTEKKTSCSPDEQKEEVDDDHYIKVMRNLDIDALTAWLTRRQMPFEGGFSGRANKLVDGCYSFWQGSATAIVNRWHDRRRHCQRSLNDDAWLSTADPEELTTPPPPAKDEMALNQGGKEPLECLYNAAMLERYILLCTQDVNGGLRDKPSKGRDFYHSCYCLSGLSIAQHYSSSSTGGDDESQQGRDIAAATVIMNPNFAAKVSASIGSSIKPNARSRVHKTHPCFNIRVEHARFVLEHFQNSVPMLQLDGEDGNKL